MEKRENFNPEKAERQGKRYCFIGTCLCLLWPAAILGDLIWGERAWWLVIYIIGILSYWGGRSLFQYGKEKQSRGRRDQVYLTLGKKTRAIDLEDAALEAGSSEAVSARELKELIEAGILPGCQVDEDAHLFLPPGSGGTRCEAPVLDLRPEEVSEEADPLMIRNQARGDAIIGGLLIVMGIIFLVPMWEDRGAPVLGIAVFLAAFFIIMGGVLIVYSVNKRAKARRYRRYKELLKGKGDLSVRLLEGGRVPLKELSERLSLPLEETRKELFLLIEGGYLRKLYLDRETEEIYGRK